MSAKIVDLSGTDDGVLVTEQLAYLLYSRQTMGDPEDPDRPGGADWRALDDANRTAWRNATDQLVADLLSSGVKLKISKRKALVQSVEKLLVAPAAPAYALKAAVAQ